MTTGCSGPSARSTVCELDRLLLDCSVQQFLATGLRKIHLDKIMPKVLEQHSMRSPGSAQRVIHRPARQKYDRGHGICFRGRLRLRGVYWDAVARTGTRLVRPYGQRHQWKRRLATSAMRGTVMRSRTARSLRDECCNDQGIGGIRCPANRSRRESKKNLRAGDTVRWPVSAASAGSMIPLRAAR